MEQTGGADMEQCFRILNYNVQGLSAEQMDEKLEMFFQDEQLQSILFLSVDILEQVMRQEDYEQEISKFQMLLPGEELVLPKQTMLAFQEEKLMFNEAYLQQILGYLEKCGRTIYLVGDQLEKLHLLMEYCKEYYPGLLCVGSFIGDDEMDDASLLNDINVTCPDLILTAIAPQLQEKWILCNLDKLNGQVCVGADVLVQAIVKDYIWMHEKEEHNFLYNRMQRCKENFIESIRGRIFRSDYEHYMKQRDAKEKG